LSQGSPEFTVGPYVSLSFRNIHAQHPLESFVGQRNRDFRIPEASFAFRQFIDGYPGVSTVIRAGKKHTDIRYDVSSLRLDIGLFATCASNHRGIVTTCHWSLDVTWNEDGLKSGNRLGTENMAWLRRFTLSLLTQHPGKMSLVMKHKSSGWNW
jgi:predicted transposase YbfD/YdcC